MVGTVVFDAHSLVQSTTSRTVQMLAVPLGLQGSRAGDRLAAAAVGRPGPAGPGRPRPAAVRARAPPDCRSVPAGSLLLRLAPAEVADTPGARPGPAGDGGTMRSTLSGGAPAGAIIERSWSPLPELHPCGYPRSCVARPAPSWGTVARLRSAGGT